MLGMVVIEVGLGNAAATEDAVVVGVDVDRLSVVCECRGDARADDRWVWLVDGDGLGRR